MRYLSVLSFLIIFLRLKYNYIIYPFPFSPLSPPIYPSVLSFKRMDSFFVNYHCVHMLACIHTHIHKYNLLRLYNVACT